MSEYRIDIQRDAQDEYKRRFRLWRDSNMKSDCDRDAMIQLVYPAALERALAAALRRAERASELNAQLRTDRAEVARLKYIISALIGTGQVSGTLIDEISDTYQVAS